MLYLIILFVFLETILIYGMLIDTTGYKKPIKRLNNYFEKGNYADFEENNSFKSIVDSKSIKKYIEKIEESTQKISRFRKLRDNIDIKLANADILLTAEEFMLASGFLVLFSIFIGYVLSSSLLGGAIIGVVVVAVIMFLLKEKQKRRIATLNDQLGDALDMMAGTLRAGYSFMQAMDTVAREMPKPISAEFGRVIKEIQVGGNMETALESMLQRVYNEDLDLLITSVLIHRQIGGNLAEILDNISSTIRERIKLKGEVKVLTGQARMSGIVVALLPFGFAIIISIMNPDHMKLLISDKLGLFLIGMALFGQLIGFLFIRKILDIKY